MSVFRRIITGATIAGDAALVKGFIALAFMFGLAAGAAVLDWRAALLVLVCFVSSGTPMIVGSIWRYLRKRAEARKAMIDEVAR